MNQSSLTLARGWVPSTLGPPAKWKVNDFLKLNSHKQKLTIFIYCIKREQNVPEQQAAVLLERQEQNFCNRTKINAVPYICHLKGLSYEIDFENVDENW